MRGRTLPQLYYLRNFCSALESLRARYAQLLSGEERAFIRDFLALPEPCQCLLARLLMRKGAIFRRSTLLYPEIGDLEAVLHHLAAQGWIDADPVLGIEELSATLTRIEWRETFGHPGSRKVPVDEGSQAKLPIAFETPAPRSMAQWHSRLANTHIRVGVEPLARRLQFLFFGNDYQTWTEFALADLGVQRYEKVPYDSASCAFTTREEIEHFYRLNECHARLRDEAPAASILIHAHRPAGVPDWLDARFAKLQFQLGEMLHRQGEHELALRTYRDSGTVEGRIKGIRLQERMGLLTTSREEAARALELARSEKERQAIARALVRLRRRLGEQVARENSLPPVQAFELRIPELSASDSVERRIGTLLSTRECPAFYVENDLLLSLFGLLFWEIIFAPLPGAFFHPFQSGPADLFTPEFGTRRATLLEAQMALLDAGAHEEVIRRHHRDKAGISNPFVRWHKLKPQVLELALACIPAAHLKLVFQRLLEDLENNCSGLPDLIHFYPQDRRYQLVEVKAPGDRLQDNQRRWMEFFTRSGIPAAVCKVSWTTLPEAPLPQYSLLP